MVFPAHNDFEQTGKRSEPFPNVKSLGNVLRRRVTSVFPETYGQILLMAVGLGALDLVFGHSLSESLLSFAIALGGFWLGTVTLGWLVRFRAGVR